MKRYYLKILIIAAVTGLACTTKVSEWVLLNAPADRYLLVYYHKGAVPETVRLRNSELENKTHMANLIFREVVKTGIQNPYYALVYKNRIFAEYSDLRSADGLTNSPLRKKIAGELMDGKLCVWLYLTTGNTDMDEAKRQVIRKSLAATPFREIIALTELDRNSAEEHHLVNMLLNVEDDLKMINEPMLFGIFGRFRVLEPLLGKGITEENLKLMTGFFTADCSCVIKDDLPGINILSEETWKNPVPARVNKILDENPHLMHH